MELSEQVHALLRRFKDLSQQSEASMRSEKINLTNDYDIVFVQDDLINVDKIDFFNDETWLCESTGTSNVKDLNRWLYEDVNVPKDVDFHSNHMLLVQEMRNAKKNIDTRTFTRPKKKFVRPSIEKYNEELHEMERNQDNSFYRERYESPSFVNNPQSFSDEKFKTASKPLHFDLSQPVMASSFDSILNNAADVDSFQNMSPPSLINSMCSSTFTNLMESSVIKNDPVLREIRDADYSAEILIQDSDPPLFQSFTESCSSLNSDSAEYFLKQTLPTLNGTFCKDTTLNVDKSLPATDCLAESGGDSTLKLNITNESTDTIVDSGNYVKSTCSNDSQIRDNLNTTFKRNITKDITADVSLSNKPERVVTPNLNETFMKSTRIYDCNSPVDSGNDEKNSSGSSITDVYFNTAVSGVKLNNQSPTEIVHCENIDPNTTINVRTPMFNGTFRKDASFSKVAGNRNSTYINNLSHEVPSRNSDVKILNYNIRHDLKDNYNDPSRRLQQQQQRHSVSYVSGSTDSLDHVSSLSNSSSRGSSRVLNMAEVDAIVELQERSLQVMSTPKPAKSMSKLFDSNLISPIARQKEHVSDSDLSSTDDFLTARSSLSKGFSGHSSRNLKTLDRNVKSLNNLKYSAELRYKPRSMNTITKLDVHAKAAAARNVDLKPSEGTGRGSFTNLKTGGPNLRGSYTNLRPVGVNLPVVTSKPKSASPHTARNVQESDEVFKVPAAPFSAVDAPASTVKPQARISSLPRPAATGIPRPTSKIPGPRTLRPATSRSNLRPLSKASIADGYF